MTALTGLLILLPQLLLPTALGVLLMRGKHFPGKIGDSAMKLKIIGASGHGRVVAEIARLNGYDEIEFYDDNPLLTESGPWPVVGGTERGLEGESPIFVAIGDPKVRSRLIERCRPELLVSLLHPSAVIAPDVQIGRGCVVMPGAVINPGSRLGTGVIVNTCASVDHDCVLRDYVHVAVGAHLCGTIEVGERTWIGAGAIVSNNLNICADCMIGAGSVVVHEIRVPGKYYGIPATLK